MVRQNIAFKESDFEKIIFDSIDYADDLDFNLSWLVNNMDMVKKGSPLVEMTLSNDEYSQTKTIYNNFDGICYIHLSNEDNLVDDKFLVLGVIIDSINDLYSIFPSEIKAYRDSFTDALSLDWKRIGGLVTTGIPLLVGGKECLYISCIFRDNHVFLVLNSIVKKINLKKGDTISLKFSNGKILDFTLDVKPVKVIRDFNFPYEDAEHVDLFRNAAFGYSFGYTFTFGRKNLRENSFVLSNKDLLLFENTPLSSFRITYNSEGGTFVDGDISNEYFDKLTCPLIVQNMFRTLLEYLRNFDPSFAKDTMYEEEDGRKKTNVIFDYCYVYLMYDNANGYYKIGMSNNPTYREGTLQSEKPTISLVACHKYPSRKFASAIETALHNVFKDFHIRGEWYKLSNEDVEIIIEGLK